MSALQRQNKSKTKATQHSSNKPKGTTRHREISDGNRDNDFNVDTGHSFFPLQLRNSVHNFGVL